MNQIYKRLSDEERDDYIWRICSGKDNGIYDLTWDDVGCILNSELDESFGSSKWRKNYQMMKKGFDRAIASGADIEEQLLELQQTEYRIKQEKTKIQTLKLAINESDRNKARAELFLEEVRIAIENAKEFPVPDFKPLAEQKVHAIGGVADAHFGKEIVINGLMGEPINVYNEDVFYDRMWELQRVYLEIIQEEGLSKISFFDLSDGIEGVLRISGLQHIKYGIVESSILYAKFMATWLNALSEFVEIDFYGCLGNHNEIRPLASKSGDFPKENTQYIVDELIKAHLQNNDRITIHNTKGLQYVDVDGYKVLATHGQDERGLVNSVIQYKEIYGVDIDLMISGHLHNSKQETVSLHTKCVQFPSLVGIDDYSMKLKKTANAEGKMILVKGSRFINIDIKL